MHSYKFKMDAQTVHKYKRKDILSIEKEYREDIKQLRLSLQCIPAITTSYKHILEIPSTANHKSRSPMKASKPVNKHHLNMTLLDYISTKPTASILSIHTPISRKSKTPNRYQARPPIPISTYYKKMHVEASKQKLNLYEFASNADLKKPRAVFWGPTLIDIYGGKNLFKGKKEDFVKKHCPTLYSKHVANNITNFKYINVKIYSMKMVSPVSSPYLRKLSEDTSRSRVKGMAIFIVSVLFNVASVSFNKALFLICSITPMEYSFMISLMCIIPYCIYGAFTKQPVIQFPPSIAKVMLIRCIIGTLNMAILTIGIKLMPVSIYAVISSIAPLFTQVFCYLLLNEKITALDVGGLVASFIGLCLIIVNPNHAANSANHDYSIWALFIPLAQAITLALIFTFTKMIIKQRVHCLAPAISVSAMICIFHSGAGFVSDSMKFSISNYNAKAVLFLAISTASNTIGFALWNLAIKYESPVKLSVLSYLSTVCYFIIDIMIYKISVDTYEIIGSIIIVGCSSSIIIYKAYFNS